MPQWIRSNNARKLFLYSSWVVVWTGVFLLLLMTPWFRQLDTSPKVDIILRVLGGGTGIIGSPASIVLLFGMAIFCVCEDNSPVWRKILWFFLFFTTASFGSAAYFFKVYRKHVRVAQV